MWPGISFLALTCLHTYMYVQHNHVGPTHQGATFQKYLSSLLADLSPTNGSPDHRVGSLSKISSSSSVSSSSMKDYIPITSPSAALLSRRGLSTGSMGALGGGGISGGMKPAASNCSLGSVGEKMTALTGSSRSRETSPCILGYDTLSMDELDITDSGEAEETALWPLSSIL